MNGHRYDLRRESRPLTGGAGSSSGVADAGALVIATGPEWRGRGIGISRKDGDPHARVQVTVQERRAADGVRYTAVFPSLPAGAYVLWRDATEPVGYVVVAGATVTEVDWWPPPPCAGV